MTQLFLNPLSKFTTDTLQTLPYATLSFFVNGSSTPKAVYADKAKVTSLGTVVTADSAGNFPPIWLDGLCRATLKSKSTLITDNPATGATQTGWPIDNIGDTNNFTAFSAWDSTFTYNITTNTFVTGPDGLYYQSIQNPNLNKIPASNPAYWSQIFLITYYNATKTYGINEIVDQNGKLYRSKVGGNLGNTPPNATWWEDLSANTQVYTAKKDVDQNVISSTTLVDATGMSIVLENGINYHIRAHILWANNSSTTNGVRLAFTGATLYSYFWMASTNSTTNTAPVAIGGSDAIYPGGLFHRLPSASTVLAGDVAIFDGIVTGTGSAFKLQFAQEAVIATNTTMKALSVMIATKLG